jgi:apolipoprotein N-acyltransferase
LLRARAARLGHLVCFEAMFPSIARRAVADGAEVLCEPDQRLLVRRGGGRTDSTRRCPWCALRRDATPARARGGATGYSAVADAGAASSREDRVRTRRPRWSRRVVPRDDLTPYARWGDVPAVAFLLVVLAWSTGLRLTNGRRRP